MTDSTDKKPRRDFLKQTVSSAAVATVSVMGADKANAQSVSSSPNQVLSQEPFAGYVWLKPSEQGFVEALVEHMCPADSLSPGGLELGLNIYFDRALGGNWGNGHRLYLKGPFPKGSPNQGYQLGLTPAELFRAGTQGLMSYCKKTFGKLFETLSSDQKENILVGMQSGKLEFDNGIPSQVYFEQLLQMFYEGMFADPIYGGNRAKAGWKMIGYPGVTANHRQNIIKFKNKPYPITPTSIADIN
jgi:gluconate 2-dehydrogenase gamma chain